MPEFILYNYFRSSASYRVRMAMEYLKVNYEYRVIHLLKDGGQNLAPEFLKLNPLGEVPCLVHQANGNEPFILTQSMAILLYLDRLVGDLFPKNPNDFVRVIQISEMINSGIHPVQNLKVLKQLTETFGATQDQRNVWVKNWITRGFEALEKTVSDVSGKCAFGDTVTAADFYVIAQIFNARRFEVEMEQFPTLVKLESYFNQQSWVKAAHPSAQPDYSAS